MVTLTESGTPVTSLEMEIRQRDNYMALQFPRLYWIPV